MRLILPLLTIFLASVSQSQEHAVNFSDAIKPHLNKYNIQSDLEFERGNIEKGNALFDSLVQNFLIGSKFNNYALKNIKGGKVKLAKIKKPIFIITYASWCVPNKGEIPALNKLAKKHSKDVQVIALFWDKKQDAGAIANKFSGKIKVCYANEAYRNDYQIVSTLKHTLGFPTSYYLNSDLNVVDIKRGGAAPAMNSTYISALNLNYNIFNDRLSSFLERKDQVKLQVAAIE